MADPVSVETIGAGFMNHGIVPVPDPSVAGNLQRVQIIGAVPQRRSLLVKNVGIVTIRLGDSNVVPETGFPLAVGEAVELDVTGAVFVCVASGGGDGSAAWIAETSLAVPAPKVV